MKRKAITVGNIEKHDIVVETSEWTGESKIFIDGKLKWKGDVWTSHVSDFKVGQDEKHSVRIRIGGAIVPEIHFFVDEKPEEKFAHDVKNRADRTSAWIIMIIVVVIAMILGFILMWWLLSSRFG